MELYSIIGGEKSEKSGYSLIKMLILLNIYTKTPNTLDFRHKNPHLQRFHAEYTKNLGYSMRFFQKIGKFTVFSIKLIIKSNNLGRKIRKIRFFAQNKYEFSQIISTNNCMWIYISTTAKTIIFHAKSRWKYLKIQILQKIPTSNCRKNQKFDKFVILHNRIQISEKFSPIISKLAFFSSVTAIVQHTKRKFLTHKLSKAAINCSHIYCEGIYSKVLQTRTILFKRTIVVTGISKSTNIPAQNTKQINLASIVNYNINIS